MLFKKKEGELSADDKLLNEQIDAILESTVGKLMTRITEEHEKKEREGLEFEKQNRAKLKVEVTKELEVREKLKEAGNIINKLETDYFEIEQKTMLEKQKKIESKTVMQKAVLEGRFAASEFVRVDKEQEAIDKKIMEETNLESNSLLGIIHDKRKEIWELEKTLYETQVRIIFLATYPGREMVRTYKDLTEFAEREIALIIADIGQAKSNLEETKVKLGWCENKGFTGYGWTFENYKEARSLIFDPIVPLAEIPKLKAELQKYKGSTTRIMASYSLRTKGVGIQGIIPGQKSITTTQSEPKKAASLQTHNLKP